MTLLALATLETPNSPEARHDIPFISMTVDINVPPPFLPPSHLLFSPRSSPFHLYHHALSPGSRLRWSLCCRTSSGTASCALRLGSVRLRKLTNAQAERAADETTSSGITASRAKTVLVDLKADIDVQVAVVLATLPNAAQNPHAVAAALQPVAALLVKAKVQLDIKVNVVTFGRKRACTGLLDDVAYDVRRRLLFSRQAKPLLPHSY